jgi:hypothetical protein
MLTRKGLAVICIAFLICASLFGFNGIYSIHSRFINQVEWTGNMMEVMSAHMDSKSSNEKPFVVIVACIKSAQGWKSVYESSLHKILIPSIWKSLTEDEKKTYRVELLLAYDQGDTFWENQENRLKIGKVLPFTLNFISVVKKREHRIPFNEACRAAYEYGADYIVRVNDDSEFFSSGWITQGVRVLGSYKPPNVGVVGPTCREGKTVILTHDMVHRTHLKVFDDYYPDEFDNWWIDDWITGVYGPTRTMRINNWIVKHHFRHHGTRYKVNDKQKTLLSQLLDRGRERVQDFLASEQTVKITPVLGTSRVAFVSGPISQVKKPSATTETYLTKYVNQFVNAATKARKRNSYGSYAIIQVFDKGFVNMTKHWTCNVRRFGMVLSAVTFVATDMDAYTQLREFDRDLNIVFVPFHRPKDQRTLEYGQVAYYELMAFRTMLLYELLRNDISFMVVESDAIWHRNALEEISNLKFDWNFDMLSASDKIQERRLQGGFQLNRATPNSKMLWAKLYENIVDMVKKFHTSYGSGSTKYVADAGSEQLMMEKLIKSTGKQIGFKLKFIPLRIVSSGQWYREASVQKALPSPAVILNNWISGNAAKTSRAKTYKHWFLSEDSSKCYDPDPVRRNQFRATIVVLTMDRFGSLQRLLTSLMAANYSTPNASNDIRLVIRIDRPKVESEAFHRVLDVANEFTHPAFSSVEVELAPANKGLRNQWFTSFQNPRGWDEIGIIFEDDLQVSPHFFRYLRLQWLFHWNNPLMGSVSLQRQTLRAKAPYKNDVNSTIVNKHRPFLYRLIGTWGLSAKASTWIDFTSTYSGKRDVGIQGLTTTQWYNNSQSTMWSQHFIHYLWTRNQFTHFVNLPNNRTLCGNWREPGVHYAGVKPSIDFPRAEHWIENSMGALDSTLITYGFDTKPEVVKFTATTLE